MLRGHVMLVERRGSWFSGTLLPSSLVDPLAGSVLCEPPPAPPPLHCRDRALSCSEIGALGNILPLLWPTYPCLPSPQAGEGRGWETVDPLACGSFNCGFFSLEGLK